MHTLPDLPQPIYKVAIAHKSLEPPWDPEYGDTERLATIGRMILPAVIAEILAMKRPLLENETLKDEIAKRLDTDTLAEWCTQCDLRVHVQCVPSERQKLNDPHESCDIIYTFIGAVHTAYGIDGVRAWLGKLIDPTYDENDEGVLKRARLEPATNGHAASQPPQPAYQPPPPPNAPPPIPSGPAAGAAALPHLNQTVAQRKIPIDWRMTSSGPSHNPQWTAECILNGIVKGSGIAQSKQAAKEQAARLTIQMMNY
ncbi:hypothetical protein PENSPDRAFT_10685 [Peniophora sp. CONT]|nr:hypothetical protein PENSPDRAFT_10685 [Peniophora sp. CONT]